MAHKSVVKVILGTHTFGDKVAWPEIVHFDDLQDIQKVLDLFVSHGGTHIDTARNYGMSEDRLGKIGAIRKFTIDTKIQGMEPGALAPEKVKASIAESLKALQTSSVNTMYLHMPDRETPLLDTARAMDEAYRDGKFKKFGLCNYTADEVHEFIRICDQEGFVKPSVYQGHYNAIVRGAEKELIPLLREHNMAYYAYSPAAGGLFSGNKSTSFRWRDTNFIGAHYKKLYSHDSVQAAIDKVLDAASKHAISGHEAAMRWTAFHGALDGAHGDGVVIGLSKLEHLEKNMVALQKGPLPEDLATAIDAIYATVEGMEPKYHM